MRWVLKAMVPPRQVGVGATWHEQGHMFSSQVVRHSVAVGAAVDAMTINVVKDLGASAVSDIEWYWYPRRLR